MPKYLVVIEPKPSSLVRERSFSHTTVEKKTVVKTVEADSHDEAAQEAMPEPNTKVRVIHMDDVTTYEVPESPKPERVNDSFF